MSRWWFRQRLSQICKGVKAPKRQSRRKYRHNPPDGKESAPHIPAATRPPHPIQLSAAERPCNVNYYNAHPRKADGSIIFPAGSAALSSLAALARIFAPFPCRHARLASLSSHPYPRILYPHPHPAALIRSVSRPRLFRSHFARSIFRPHPQKQSLSRTRKAKRACKLPRDSSVSADTRRKTAGNR